MHKPAQVELQLDWPQLPYSETLGPITVGGSPAHYRKRQPNIPYTKKAPTLICCDSLLEVAITVFVIVIVMPPPLLFFLCTVKVLYIVVVMTEFYHFSL